MMMKMMMTMIILTTAFRSHMKQNITDEIRNKRVCNAIITQGDHGLSKRVDGRETTSRLCFDVVVWSCIPYTADLRRTFAQGVV